MDLEKFMYHFNLSTTLSVKDVRELCFKINSGIIEDRLNVLVRDCEINHVTATQWNTTQLLK